MSRLLCLAELLRHVRRHKSTRSGGCTRRKGLSTAPGVLSTPESPRETAVSTSTQQVAHRLSTGGHRSLDPVHLLGHGSDSPPTSKRRLSTLSQQLLHRLSTGCPRSGQI